LVITSDSNLYGERKKEKTHFIFYKQLEMSRLLGLKHKIYRQISPFTTSKQL